MSETALKRPLQASKRQASLTAFTLSGAVGTIYGKEENGNWQEGNASYEESNLGARLGDDARGNQDIGRRV